jgi:peptidyl-prolyl cis-trans isomerase A (cyclophilin A)
MVSHRFFGFALLSIAACSRTTEELKPEPVQATPASTASVTAAKTASSALPSASNGALASSSASEALSSTSEPAAPARPAAAGTVSPDDPLAGKWSLADASKALPGKGALLATFDVTLDGASRKIECKLLSEKAPVTVANFMGLAMGTRPWKDPSGKWVKKPAYDGTIFHRIIAGFMIQGGDARGNGSGEPGYVIPDELWTGAKHDKAGLLCMANRGPNTNGAQFFITDAAAAHLDVSYTIFGECEPTGIVHEIAKTPVMGEKPIKTVTIKSVKITRVEAKKK